MRPLLGLRGGRAGGFILKRVTRTKTARRRGLPAFSVRTRLIAVITIVAALGMIAVGFAVFLQERSRTLQQVDALLQGGLDTARFLVEQGDPRAGTWTSTSEALAAVVQRTAPDDNTGTVGLLNGAPRLVPGVALDVDLLTQPGFILHVEDATAGGDPVIGTYAENGVVWRYLATPISVGDGDDGTFVLAYDLNAELAELDQSAQVWVIASAITIAVIAGAAALATTRLLRPIRQMRDTAERVSGQSVTERIPIQGRDDVSGLAATMNDMLDRIDDALESQRRLLSDVGHELKTPLTIVRGNLEVLDPDDPRDVRETRNLVVDELERMARLVQDLAAAAALHGPAPVKPEEVDAADLVRQIIRKSEGITGADVETGPIAEVVTALDPARVTQAALQLAQNAVTHGGGRLVISSAVVDDRWELSVRDFGPGVPDPAKERVFDRFHRGPDTDAAGSGLGLNIVQVIARAHGGTARVTDALGGGAVFTLSIPLSTSRLRVPEGLVIPPRPDLPSPPASAPHSSSPAPTAAPAAP